jgi:hypothetical protein
MRAVFRGTALRLSTLLVLPLLPLAFHPFEQRDEILLDGLQLLRPLQPLPYRGGLLLEALEVQCRQGPRQLVEPPEGLLEPLELRP